jgi:large subunit ribosomal protein L21e
VIDFPAFNKMTKRVGTSRSKSRQVLKKSVRQKGKISLSKFFAKFIEGDRVVLKMDSAIQKGSYHIRFHGRAGIVKNKQGACYNVEIKDGSKKKMLCLHPVHLKKML